jgi:hypothetical protein
MPGGPGSTHSPPAPGEPEPEPVELIPPAVGVGDAAGDGGVDGDGLGAGVDLAGDGVAEGDGEAPVAPAPSPDRLCAGGCDCPGVIGDVEPGRPPGSSSAPLPGGATAAGTGVPCPADPLACGS